ncbi:hypothetical protein WG922_07305 [Ramlibacter sp. AN1015]|uniref:hypothetical protein n=1 Tax=Ramlibacter sp. AN1015 TaxID=3133428 RepID=UPI0030C4BC5E
MMTDMGGGMMVAGLVLQLLVFLAFMWVLYIVIRAGVRDGIDQSRLGKLPGTSQPGPGSTFGPGA